MATILYVQGCLLQYYFSELFVSVLFFRIIYVGMQFKKKEGKQYTRAYNGINHLQLCTFPSQSGL